MDRTVYKLEIVLNLLWLQIKETANRSPVMCQKLGKKILNNFNFFKHYLFLKNFYYSKIEDYISMQ